ncbi:MAG TPA: ACT domain-containing protein [Nitrososphaerales archaeon]|nr:ACT domain-containing protein [Nitrososphaerales archaeon]
MARKRPKSVNALSVSRAVKEVVESDFSVRDALARNYANLSALGKLLLPRVEARTGRKVGEQGIVSALKRLREGIPQASEAVGKVIAGSIVNVRTRVSRLSVEKTKRTLQAVSVLLSTYQEDFIQVSESLSSITLIFDQRLHGKVKRALSGAEVLEEGEECAAITVHSPEAIISTPGCVSSFYDQLARKRVNVEDTVSCYTDTILVVSMKDASRAFEALTELVGDEQRKLGEDGQE